MLISRYVLASLALIALAGCHRDHRRTVAVIPKGSSHLYWQSVHAGAAKAGKELNVDIVWDGPPGETDYAGQLQIIDAMINRHVDAIALAPIDRKAMVSGVDRAASQHIPVIIFDSAVDTGSYVSMVATDNYKAGQLGAERLAKILGGKGNVAMVKVQPGAASTEAREKGFEDVMAKEYPDIHIVDARFGMADVAKSLTVSENILTAHPDLDGIFASNESSTMGAVQALKSRHGEHVKLVGFDWSPALAADLKSGLIDSLVVQDPFKMGYLSVVTAIDKLNGKAVPKSQPLPARVVDRNNMNDPDVQAQINPDMKYLQ